MQISKQFNPFYTDLENIKVAPDCVMTFTYLDAGGADERVQTIVYSSASLGKTRTETYVYAGTTPNFRISTITIS